MLNQTTVTSRSVVAVALQDLSKIPYSQEMPWNPMYLEQVPYHQTTGSFPPYILEANVRFRKEQ